MSEEKSMRASCPYAKKCGGCDYQGISYREQLKRKQKTVQDLLGGFAKVEPIMQAEHPEHYRNKVHGVFGRDKKGNVFTGIYEEKSHRIVPVENCGIENSGATAILTTLCDMAKQFKLRIYDEDKETGLLRHALIRVGVRTGEIMVVLVLADPIMPSKNNFVKELCRRHPEITTIVLNINDKHTSMVLGERNITLYGKGYIEDILCGIRFRISPSSFYQINPEQTEKLYRKAMEFAALTGEEIVIDAYCGIGTIGMCAADKAKEVLGVELNKEAIRDAFQNAKRNQLQNVRFIHDDAGKYMVRMAGEHQKADVVIMDPPRSGSTPEFIESVNKLKPERVVYVSCDPVTLKRDLELFAKKGWKVKRIQPVDMFPYTKHVETVVQLSKGDIDRDCSERKSITKAGDTGTISGYSKGNKAHETTNVKIDFSLENLDMSELRGKATYEQIKDYVREQTGFRVSTLYISQVKRKCGLEVGESYNKPKSDDARQPQCTLEKEEAIMQALKHFGVI